MSLHTMRALILISLLLPGIAMSASVKEEITAMCKAQAEAWSRGDLDGFMKSYDSSGVLVFIGSNGPIRDWKVMKDHYEAKYKTGQNDFGKLEFTDMEVEELAPGIARSWGKWNLQTKDQKLSGWFTLILKKFPDGWRIIHDHSS
jgi:ketosteroid isomerase-like protein